MELLRRNMGWGGIFSCVFLGVFVKMGLVNIMISGVLVSIMGHSESIKED